MLFVRFREEWPNMDHSSFETGLSVPEVAKALDGNSEKIMASLMSKLEEAQPRDNYPELMNLCIIFLEGTPPKGIRFVYPGAVSQARWMGKAIYCFKIFMFKKQFPLSKHQEMGIQRVCLFIVKLYAEAWLTTSVAVESPRRDLQFLKNLVAYRDEDQLVATAAMKAFLNHLWYLGDELAVMALFDSAVPLAVKRKMVEALKSEDNCPDEPCQRPLVKPADAVVWSQKDLSDLVSPHSMKLFKRFKIDSSFLDVDPELWEDDPHYEKGRSVLRTLTVVNDVAERAVALASTFANKLTADEKQRQCAFQVVSDFRKKCPDTKKPTLKKPTLKKPY